MKPLLVLQVPEDLTPDPVTLRRLQVWAEAEFGANLQVEGRAWPARGGRLRLVGRWLFAPSDVWARLAGRLQRTLHPVGVDA